MVNGTDSEVRCLGGRSPKSQDSYPVSPRPFSSPSMSPSHGMNIHNLASGKGSAAHFSGEIQSYDIIFIFFNHNKILRNLDTSVAALPCVYLISRYSGTNACDLVPGSNLSYF